MEFCTNHPELARLVGIFRSDSGGPGSLLAFACALHHTDHVQYYTAASTRDEGVKFPLTHGLIWDLVRWAKAHGAKSFDMGGVTAGNVASGDPLGGISDFKRFFSKTPVDAGEEWELEPRAASAKFAQFISTAAYRFSTRKRS